MRFVTLILLVLAGCTRTVYLPAAGKTYALPADGSKDIQGRPFPWMGTEAPAEILRLPLYDKDGNLQWLYIPVATNSLVLTWRAL
jgi:hypothetical protein